MDIAKAVRLNNKLRQFYKNKPITMRFYNNLAIFGSIV